MSISDRFRFRAWDGKKMHKDCGLVRGLTMDELRPIYDHYDRYNTILSKCVIMQSTGITDKNGVEIFEGDVVGTNGFISTVAWNEETCAFCSTWCKGMDRSDHLYGASSVCEVIGNIYENPELLGATDAA